MREAQRQVREFHLAIDQPTAPAEPKFRNQKLRASLILEEALETVVALVGYRTASSMLAGALFRLTDIYNKDPSDKRHPDLAETIDGLCDTIVVCLGTAEDIGVELAPFFDEVMRTNMAKVNGPVDANGKRGKPPGWTPPDITGILRDVVAGTDRR